MALVKCPQCGSEVAIPGPPTAASVNLACPVCESRLEVSVNLDAAGSHVTARLHQEPIEGVPEGRPDFSATVPLGSGTSILAEGSPAPPSRRVETVPQASLVALGTDTTTARYALGSKVTTVGRETADIVIADDAISSRHFEIEARGREFYLHDLDSSNGTFVNDERVSAVRLASGDTIRIGQTAFAFKVVDAIAVEPSD